MYICIECGNLFEEGEQRREREYMGECHGSPAYEEYAVCPSCGGEYDEAVRCAECNHYAPVSKMDEDLCSECAEKTNKEFQLVLLNCFSPAQREYLKYVYEIAG